MLRRRPILVDPLWREALPEQLTGRPVVPLSENRSMITGSRYSRDTSRGHGERLEPLACLVLQLSAGALEIGKPTLGDGLALDLRL